MGHLKMRFEFADAHTWLLPYVRLRFVVEKEKDVETEGKTGGLVIIEQHF